MSEITLIVVGIAQWAIGFLTAALYFKTRQTTKLLEVERERDRLWDALHLRSTPPTTAAERGGENAGEGL